MTLPSQRTPGPDHRADEPGTIARLLSSPPFRTFLQGLGTDVGIAVLFVLYDGLNSGTPDYRLLFLTLLKTAVMTALSYVMKKVVPPSYNHSSSSPRGRHGG